jgi:hypothetical protein
MWSMSGRPCNPDSDLKRLWRAFLPGTPFPQCGTPADTASSASENSAPAPGAPATPADAELPARRARRET